MRFPRFGVKQPSEAKNRAEALNFAAHQFLAHRNKSGGRARKLSLAATVLATLRITNRVAKDTSPVRSKAPSQKRLLWGRCGSAVETPALPAGLEILFFCSPSQGWYC